MSHADERAPWRRPPEVDPRSCTACGLCVQACVAGVLEIHEACAEVVHPDGCIGCGHCAAVCPEAAVRHDPTAADRIQLAPHGSLPAPDAFLRLQRERRSIRLYRPEPVPEVMLRQVLEAARYTPTGTNSQNVRYLALAEPSTIFELRDRVLGFYDRLFRRVEHPLGVWVLRLLAGRKAVKELRKHIPAVERARNRIREGEDPLLFHAPLVLLAHAPSGDPCSAFNCCAALYAASLMAHCLGLGCCFNGFVENALVHHRPLRRWLGLPRGHRCHAVMTVGFPRVEYRRLVAREPPRVRHI